MANALLWLISLIAAAVGVYLLWGRDDNKVAIVTRRLLIAASIAATMAMADGKTWGAGVWAGYSAIVFVWMLPVLWILQKIRGRGGDGHMRGSNLQNAKTVARMIKEKSRFDIGSVPVPVDLETRNFLLAGSPGTGKSQALTRALDALRADDAHAVIADASGIYLSRYYDSARDVILCPFDERAEPWSPLAEIETVADVPALTKSLIPDSEGSAREWNGYAQTVLEPLLEHCFTQRKTNADLFSLACVADLAELREILAGSPAAPLVAEGNERMFGSVRAILGSYLKALQYLHPDAGVDGSFSIRRHIVEQQPGWIFLTYQQQHRDAQKSLIAAQIDIASRAVLSLPPDLNRRVVFALDELPLLGKVQSIVDLLTNGRKHGAMIFAGLQTIAQLRDSYGRETAQTLLACLGSWLVLRVSDAETAEYMSKYLGEEEKTRIVQSGGTSSQGFLQGSRNEGWQQQIVKDRIVMPSELQNLPDLVGIFNLAGPVPSAAVSLPLAERRPDAAPAFVAAQPRARVIKKPETALTADPPEKTPAAITAETDTALDLL